MQTTPADTVVRLMPHQAKAWQAETRFDVRVWHRRAGKTFFTILRKLARLEEQGRGDWQGFYLAPTRVQARQIAWPYLAQFAAPLGATLAVGELKVILPGRGFIQLLGAEQYDRLRGLYADDVTLDEAADIPSAAWSEVLSPMLSDRKGRATFMGTPRGRMNLLHQVYDLAGSGDPEWSRSRLTWRDTGALDESEIKRNRKAMSEAQFRQEFECSFDGALPGAFYQREMEELEASGRVTTVRHEPREPVVAALDLGHRDLMPVIWTQRIGTETRVLACRAYQFTSIPDMVRDWRSLPWPTDRVILPHDAKVRELGSGRTREETFGSLGVETTIAPNQPVDEGIEAVRVLLGSCIFDRDETRTLREALASYRSEIDEVRGVYKVTPLHDWASHYADAMRYLAVGDTGPSWQRQAQRPRLGGVYA